MGAVMDESYVELYAGTDIPGAIQWLIALADPTARARCTTPTFHPLPADLSYGEDTDWMAAADNLAEAIGMKLHRITDVWVLAPRMPEVHVHVTLDGKELRRGLDIEAKAALGKLGMLGSVS
jgi:hypothetical protein